MSSSDFVPRSELEEILKTQRAAFEASITSFMTAVSQRVDSVLTQIVEVKVTLASAEARLSSLEATQPDLQRTLADATTSIESIEGQVDYLENQSRRNNLRLDGVAETPNESWDLTETKVRDTLVTKLGFTSTEAGAFRIERAHRTGKSRVPPSPSSRAPRPSRPIVFKLNSFKDREAILKRAKDRRPTGVFFNKDFSQRVLEARKRQLPDLKKHREEGKIAYFSYDRLVVRNGDRVRPRN